MIALLIIGSGEGKIERAFCFTLSAQRPRVECPPPFGMGKGGGGGGEFLYSCFKSLLPSINIPAPSPLGQIGGNSPGRPSRYVRSYVPKNLLGNQVRSEGGGKQ
jgi:hypothetical protein